MNYTKKKIRRKGTPPTNQAKPCPPIPPYRILPVTPGRSLATGQPSPETPSAGPIRAAHGTPLCPGFYDSCVVQSPY